MRKNENISERTGYDVENKNKYLLNELQRVGEIAIAFSGGVDSTFLLQSAYDVLGNNAIAFTARSPLHPAPETEFAMTFAKQLGIRHYIIDTNEMAISAFVENTHDRCYVCKKNLFRKISKISLAAGIETIAHGANLDDLDDFRPGFRAASEMGIVAPLINACLTKQEIRVLSRQQGLPTWNNPAMSCLATRIPYAVPITLEKLKMIEQAEAFIVSSGFNTCRVRYHGEMARIEVPAEDMSKFQNSKCRKAIVKQLETIGFKYVVMDLEGYVQGSMNREIKKK
jgi:uncharacterized protein